MNFTATDFKNVRKTSWTMIALAIIIDMIFLAVAMLIVLPFFQSSFPVRDLTNGIIQTTFLFSIARFALVAGGVAMLLGGLRFRDIGLQWRKLPAGALVVFGLWIVMQVIGAILSLIASGTIAISPIWTPDNLAPIAGEIIAQFLGNAFAEEVIFRGFLLAQIYVLLKPIIVGHRRLMAASLLISQLIFSLSHIPQRLVHNYSAPELLFSLLILWVFGIILAALYVRTGNLFLVIGVHALVNAPVTVVAWPSQGLASLMPFLLTLVLLALWGPLRRLNAKLAEKAS